MLQIKGKTCLLIKDYITIRFSINRSIHGYYGTSLLHGNLRYYGKVYVDRQLLDIN